MNLYQTMMDSTIYMLLAQQGVEITIGSDSVTVLISENSNATLGNYLDLTIISTVEIPKGTVFSYNDKDYLMLVSATNEKYTSYYSGVCREMRRKEDFEKVIDGELIQSLINKFGITATRNNNGTSDSKNILIFETRFTVDTKHNDKKIFATTELKRGDFIVYGNNTYIVNSPVVYKDERYYECYIRLCYITSDCHMSTIKIVNRLPVIVDLGYVSVTGYLTNTMVDEATGMISVQQQKMTLTTQMTQDILNIISNTSKFEDLNFSSFTSSKDFEVTGVDRTIDGIAIIYLNMVVG